LSFTFLKMSEFRQEPYFLALFLNSASTLFQILFILIIFATHNFKDFKLHYSAIRLYLHKFKLIMKTRLEHPLAFLLTFLMFLMLIYLLFPFIMNTEIITKSSLHIVAFLLEFEKDKH
jgi:hypothetical protein